MMDEDSHDRNTLGRLRPGADRDQSGISPYPDRREGEGGWVCVFNHTTRDIGWSTTGGEGTLKFGARHTGLAVLPLVAKGYASSPPLRSPFSGNVRQRLWRRGPRRRPTT